MNSYISIFLNYYKCYFVHFIIKDVKASRYFSVMLILNFVFYHHYDAGWAVVNILFVLRIIFKYCTLLIKNCDMQMFLALLLL